MSSSGFGCVRIRLCPDSADVVILKRQTNTGNFSGKASKKQAAPPDKDPANSHLKISFK